MTADAVLSHRPRTVHVVPLTSNVDRALPTEVVVSATGLDARSAAQCHLCTVVSIDRFEDGHYWSIGPASLAQIRSVLGDRLDIG